MKNTVRKATSFLLVIMLLLSATNVFATNAFSGDDVLYDYEPCSEDDLLMAFGDDEFEREISYFHDLPIIDVSYWLDDDYFGLIMPLSSLSVGVNGNATSSTTVELAGSLFNPDNEMITFRGFWLRRDGCDEVREEAAVVVQGIGGSSFSAPVGGLREGATYNIRAVARVPGMEASARQSPVMRITMPSATPTPTPTTPPGGTTPTPTAPPGGNTPTPTAPPGGNTPTPTPVPTPTPTPAPFFDFASNTAPWNGSEWRISAGAASTISIVNASQRWSWSGGSESWITVSGPGEPGTQLSISVQANEGSSRSTTITVTSGDLPPRTLDIIQSAPVVDIRGTRVIECFNRRGYVNVSSAAAMSPWNASGSVAEMPIWNFVHIYDNVFAISNDTTGRFLTETNGDLRHEATISGTGSLTNNRQRWRLIPQSNGSFRIRSISNPSLYVENGSFDISLSNRSNNNNQLWWIEHIWHIDSNDRHSVSFEFWAGDIYVFIEPIAPYPANFNFESRMETAQAAWASVLGVRFHRANNVANATIRALGGCRYEIQYVLRRPDAFCPDRMRYGVALSTSERGGIAEGTIHAGGVTRSVFRQSGTETIAVFSNSGSWETRNYRNVNFATMSAMHELGHALGYRGHSPNRSDVMIGIVPTISSPNVVLNPAEVEHLRQIYRMFRN